MSGQYIQWPTQSGQIPKYANFAALPAVAQNGDVAVTLDTDVIYVFNGVTWLPSAGPGVPLAIGTFDGQPASSNGASIASSQLFMQSADATHPGLANIGTQTFAGAKTFSTTITLSSFVTAGIVLNNSSGVLSTALKLAEILGGTNQSTYVTGDTLYASAANTLSKRAIGSTGDILTVAGGIPTWAPPATSGTVTSVGLSVPAASILSVTNSPITSSGNINLLTTGTSGGIPYFSSTSQLSSSALLTANAIILGGGAGATPVSLGSLGTTTTVLHGNAAGVPSFGAVSLTADVSGVLPVANGGTGATAFTAGSVVFAGASGIYTQDNAHLFWDDTSNFLGIGIASPSTFLHVSAEGTIPAATMITSPTVLISRDSGSARLNFSSTGSGANTAPSIFFNKARGTVDVPTTVASGDTLSEISVRGYDGTSSATSGSIRAIVSGAVSTGVVPTDWTFYANSSGVTERFRIRSTGVINIAGFTTTGVVTNDSAGNLATALTLVETLGGTNQSSYATGDTLYASGVNTLSKRTIGSTGDVLTVAGGVPTWAAPATSGTVTSVALTVPAASLFSVTGSPVTSSGTLAIATTGTSGGVPYFSSTSQLSSSALLTASALVLGGGAGSAPTALGSLGTTTTVLHGNAAGAPTFGAVSLTADVSGTLPIANGGTNITTYTTGDLLYASATNVLSKLPIGSATNVLTVAGGVPTWGAAGAGTVSSVALSVPATSIFGVTGSPVTTSGTLGLTTTGTSGGLLYFSSTSQVASSALLTANAIVLGGGAGTAPAVLGSLGTTTTVLHGNAGGAPTFAAVSLTADVSGTLPIANGGTNSTATATAGGVGYGTGTAHAYTAAGSTGQVIISAGAGAPVWGTDVLGVATNSSAAAGYKGEYIESVVNSATSYPNTTGTVGDLTNITLTAGDWDITCNVVSIANGAVITQNLLFVGTVSGDNETGENISNLATGGIPNASTDCSYTVASYRQTISGSTTYYAKLYSSYSVATPKYRVRLCARRRR